MSNSRCLLKIFSSIVDEEAYANLALKQGLKAVTDSRDKRFISAAIYTTLEHLSHIDYIASYYIKGKPKKAIRNIIRLGIGQIMFMNRPNSAVCNECVSLTRDIGKSAMAGFVNGVLRNICRGVEQNSLPELPSETNQRLAVLTGYPLWFVDEYIERFGSDTAYEILSVTDNSLSLRAQYPYTVEQLKNELDKMGISYKSGELLSDVLKISGGDDITNEELFLSGKITIQSESSCIVCNALDVKPGMRVLDACAAPGGKSACIASITHNACEILACELHPHRAELIKSTFSRLNVANAEVITCDATELNSELIDSFDRVLCDVPCSGLGVVGKPDVRYHKDASSVEDIAKIQLAIIENCKNYVKPGGLLVYSTCTVSRRENEEIITAFLENNPDFMPDSDLNHSLPQGLKERGQQGQLALLPHIDKTEGFYIARLKRIK